MGLSLVRSTKQEAGLRGQESQMQGDPPTLEGVVEYMELILLYFIFCW